MKLSFILSSLHLSGGIWILIDYSNRLHERGHHVSLIFPTGSKDADMARELHPGISLVETPTYIPLEKENTFQMARLAWQLAQSTPKSDFIISTHTPTTVSGFIASQIMRKGIPVWFYMDYLEMYLDRPIETWLLKNALKWNKMAVVLSGHSKKELESYVPGKKANVVGQGISHVEFFKPNPSMKLATNSGRPLYILTMGDKRPRKGFQDFLEAISIVHKEIKNIHLWIFSKEKIKIETEIPFDYLYRPSRAELANLFANCDVFVSASWWESFGLPPLEAMACGAPVVMTDARGVGDYARNEENCLLIPPQSPGTLAKAIIRVLTDRELELKLRENGPSTASEFTWERSIDRFEKALVQQDLFM